MDDCDFSLSCGSADKHVPLFIPSIYLTDVLPSDKMAVIVMSKVMELLLPHNLERSVPLVQAALKVGAAVEHEVVIIFSLA